MFHYEDQINITLISGSGGPGSNSFFRTRTNPRGGPDGGSGGKGGDILLAAKRNIKNFQHLKKKHRFKAPNGQPGEGQSKSGRQGKSTCIPLPIGTLVRDRKRKVLVDFDKAFSHTFLQGGKGGMGNAFFKTSRHQAPKEFQKGEKGIEKRVVFEFKPIIQVAIIGHTNTGKSSFFNEITRAKSTIGDYAYTTLAPHYGQIKNFPPSSLIMDLPGLSKGASQSSQKGLSFLRSLQRASLLIHFIDSSLKEALKAKEEIEKELKIFDKKFPETLFTPLSQKRILTVFTKIDLLKTKKFPYKKTKDTFFLSNKTKIGLKELLVAIKKELYS